MLIFQLATWKYHQKIYNIILVGGIPTPLKNTTSWDDDIPN